MTVDRRWLLRAGGVAGAVHAAGIASQAGAQTGGAAERLYWVARTSMPTPRSDLGVAVAANGRLYAVGGSGAPGAATAVEEYDPATDTWRARAPMPTGRHSLGVAAAPNGRLYAIGGRAGAAEVATVEEFAPERDAWAPRAKMPTARASVQLVAATNGRLYAIGGFNREFGGPLGYLATVEEYDPAADTWRGRANMPIMRVGHAAAAAPNGKIYVVGGQDTSAAHLPVLLEYDPMADRWAARARMPTERVDLALAAAPDGRLYAAGGAIIRRANAIDVVEAYDPQTDRWSTQAPLPVARRSFGLVALPGGAGGLRLFAVGGLGWSTRSETLAAVEEAGLGAPPAAVQRPQPQGATTDSAPPGTVEPSSDAPAEAPTDAPANGPPAEEDQSDGEG